MNQLDYNGYMGSAEVDVEGNALVGNLMFIRDVITYSGTTPKELEKAFREAVDEYLQTCKDLGRQPDMPCKGSFNVRISPDLHRQAAIAAALLGVSLNDFVGSAIGAAVHSHQGQGKIQHTHVHQYTVTLVGSEQPTEVMTSTTHALVNLREAHATAH